MDAGPSASCGMRCQNLVVATLAVTLLAFGCAEPEQSTLDLRIESFAITLSPLKINESESNIVASMIYAPLVKVQMSGEIEPRIAESWREVDHQTLEFKLRKDVAFSNDQPVTADDVVYSLCQAMQPSSAWAWALASILRTPSQDGTTVDCTGLTAIDPVTVQIKQQEPVDWLLHALDGPAGWIVPRNAKEGEYGVMPGAGPYRLGKVNAGVSIELIAQSKGPAVKPGFEKVVFHHIPGPDRAGVMFREGALDVLSLNSPTLLKLVLGNNLRSPELKGRKLVSANSDRVRLLLVNEAALRQKGFSAEQVAAFKRTMRNRIDRSAIIKMSEGLLSSPLYTAFLPAADAAKSGGDEGASGVDFPQTRLTILSEPDPYSDVIASVIAKTPVPNVSFDYKGLEKGLLINAMVKKDYDLVSIVLDANVHAPDFWTAFFTDGNPFSAFGEPLINPGSFDLRRPEDRIKAAQIIDSEGNWIPVVRETRLIAIQAGIVNVNVTPSGFLALDAVARE